MYTETNNFSIRNVILQFLFVALFIFILIWLFPMKSDMKKAISSIDNANNFDNLSVLYDRIFNENLNTMKEAAQSYYTISRLPQKVGDSTKITLREMLDKKIILPFTDKNGKQCDLDASYVQITKHNDEYIMKVNLKCGKEENYLLVHMGCYDYCSQTICEKKGTTTKVYKKTNTTKKVTPAAPKYRTLYEYKKTTKGTTRYTDWSNWSTLEVKETDTVEVQSRNEISEETYYTNWSEWSTKEVKQTDTIDVQTKEDTKTSTNYTNWSEWSTNEIDETNNIDVETKTETKKVFKGNKDVTTTDYSKPKYETLQVPIGSKTITTCTQYNITSTVSGFNETYLGMQKFSTKQTSSALIRYELVGTYNWYCDGECTAGKTFVYKVYQRTPITSTSYSCAKRNTERSVILGNRTILTGYGTKTTTSPVYEDETTTYYRYRRLETKTTTTKYYRYRELITKGEKTTFYRYRKKIVTPGTVSLKWSTYNDTKLLNAGYNYTGNTKTERIK